MEATKVRAMRPSSLCAIPVSILQFPVDVRITISKENYLKAIAEAESEGETVIAATLARWLAVSAPAVTMA